MAIDVTDRFPWNQMEERTVDGQSMIFIPKIYVKTEVDENNLPTYYISDSLQDDFHLHPTFMWNGSETTEGILISKYVAGGNASNPTSLASQSRIGNINYNNAHTAGLARNVSGGGEEKQGWHSYNIYEHHLIARLMLIEYGSADLQTILTGSNSGMGANYHGITDVWGNNSYGFWIDGLDTLGTNNSLRIFDNKGNCTMVETGWTNYQAGWIRNCSTLSGTDFDLGDVFLASEVDGTESNGSFGDYQYLYPGNAFGANWSSTSYYGPFNLNGAGVTGTNSGLGFRLAKWC